MYLLLVVTNWFHGVSKGGDIDAGIACAVDEKHVIKDLSSHQTWVQFCLGCFDKPTPSPCGTYVGFDAFISL